MTRVDGKVLLTVRQAAGISIGSVVAVIGCVITVATFLGVTPKAIAEREARTLAVEYAVRDLPTIGVKIDQVASDVAEIKRLLKLYEITDDNLAPRRDPR